MAPAWTSAPKPEKRGRSVIGGPWSGVTTSPTPAAPTENATSARPHVSGSGSATSIVSVPPTATCRSAVTSSARSMPSVSPAASRSSVPVSSRRSGSCPDDLSTKPPGSARPSLSSTPAACAAALSSAWMSPD